MNFKGVSSILTLSVLLASTVFGQTPSSQPPPKAGDTKTDQEKAQAALEKKALALLDDVLKESQNLRLAENRIRVQATAAELLWKHNEKRARALFKQAVDSFVELKATEDELTSAENPYVLEFFGANAYTRDPGLMQFRAQIQQELLQSLTRHDAKLARDFLRAISRPDNRENTGHSNRGDQSETELNLAGQIAATDPKEALQIAQEHLDKGFHYGLANVLSRLRQKDKEAAEKLTSGIMKKLRGENLATNLQAATLAIMLLGQDGEVVDDDDEDDDSDARQNATAGSPALDEDTTRELVEMLVSAALNQSAKKPAGHEDENEGPPLLASLGNLMPKVEKYAPSRASLLRKRISEYEADMNPRERSYKDYETVMQRGDAQALMDAAEKATPEIKGMLTMQAVMKVAGDGDFDRARQMISEQINDAGQRKQLLAMIDRQALQHASTSGKIEEARPLLARLPPQERAMMLAHFAASAIGRGDKKLGLQLLDEARNLIGAQAANYLELGALLQIAQSYSSFEPARSFDIIEPAIEQLNGLMSAITSLDGFEYWQHFKDGELIFGGPSMVVNTAFQCAKHLAVLSRADFDRAKLAADRFARSDLRIMARLFVAQGALSSQLHIDNLPITGRRFFGPRY